MDGSRKDGRRFCFFYVRQRESCSRSLGWFWGRKVADVLIHNAGGLKQAWARFTERLGGFLLMVELHGSVKCFRRKLQEECDGVALDKWVLTFFKVGPVSICTVVLRTHLQSNATLFLSDVTQEFHLR